MSWIQIILLILNLLRNLQTSKTEEEFLATSSAQKIGDGQIGRWLWENREQIIEFIIDLFERFSGSGVGTLDSGSDEIVTLLEELIGR